MANKISGLSSDSAPVGAGRPANTARDAATGSSSSAPTPASTSSGNSGDVHITDSASQLATLEQTLHSLPAVDDARVTQVRTAIEQGTYRVQPQQIADQLLQLEHSLAQLPEE
ncbi:MAG TPA: flagellar biosynthesis anti-sigma factor FlgM [Steroidobacteraceae bacterium]|jgi:negative regulator of flagellin synthesis FlgM|nr:flagellar biosynthesis anti-sigma factor FlgM [Steroidobacteraceae bacterium]